MAGRVVLRATIAAVSFLLVIIGLAGVPEDLSTWSTWLDNLDEKFVGVSLLLIGIAVGVVAMRMKNYPQVVPDNPNTKQRIGIRMTDSYGSFASTSIKNQDVAVDGKNSKMGLRDTNIE